MKTNNSIFDTFKEGFDAGFYKRLNGNSALDLYVGKNDSGLYSFEYRGTFTPIKVKCSELILVKQFKHDNRVERNFQGVFFNQHDKRKKDKQRKLLKTHGN